MLGKRNSLRSGLANGQVTRYSHSASAAQTLWSNGSTCFGLQRWNYDQACHDRTLVSVEFHVIKSQRTQLRPTGKMLRPDTLAKAHSNPGQADAFTRRYGHARTGRADLGTNFIKVARAPARFRAFPDDAWITLKGDKPVACVGPILKLLDGHVIAGLAAGATGE